MATAPRLATRGRIAELARPTRIPRTLLASLTLLIVAAVGLLQVLQSSSTATAGYALGALERERTTLNAQVRTLEADIARTAGQDQLRQMAIQRLGMVPAQQTIRITVDKPAPALPALPERYVIRPAAQGEPSLSWWQQLLQLVPGFR